MSEGIASSEDTSGVVSKEEMSELNETGGSEFVVGLDVDTINGHGGGELGVSMDDLVEQT